MNKKSYWETRLAEIIRASEDIQPENKNNHTVNKLKDSLRSTLDLLDRIGDKCEGWWPAIWATVAGALAILGQLANLIAMYMKAHGIQKWP